jgi:hypothetical protein
VAARHKEDTGLRVVPAVARHTLAENKLFAIALVPALLLRVDAELGYRWQAWFNDSWDYVDSAVTLRLSTTRPSGYSLYLWLLKPFHSFALVTISQHLMGLAVAVMIYALARHRFGAPSWLAVLMTLPVLYDGFEIQLEHLIMSDTLFLFLALLAATVLLWSPLRAGTAPWWRSPWLRCAVAGALLGLSALVRSTGLPLIPLFALFLLLCLALDRAGWRAVTVSIAAFAVAAVVPLAGYAGWFDRQHGSFNMSESTGIFLYSRVMTFADCSRMRLTPDLLPLCTAVPPAQRPIAQAYIWTPASPLDRFPPPMFSPLRNSLGQQFAIKAVEAQPLDYARVVFDDTWRSFDWPRTVFPNGSTYDEYLFGYRSVAISGGHRADGYPSSAAAYLQGGSPLTAVVNPFAGAIRVYQRYVWLPGTIFGLILLAGLLGVAFRWRRGGRAALLPWASSVALIVIPAATAEFDYRYVTTAMPFACLAVAVAFGRRADGARAGAGDATSGTSGLPVLGAGAGVDAGTGTGAGAGAGAGLAAGGEPGRTPGLPRRVPGDGPGRGAAHARDDQRDLAPDTP